jgi:hypothetical protein
MVHRIIGLLVALLVLLPSVARADWRSDAIAETLAITATAATTDQSSAVIIKPLNASGMVIFVDVTVGSTLAIEPEIDVYSTVLDEWFAWCTNIGGAAPITAVATYAFAVVNKGATGNYTIADEYIGLPTRFRIRMDHTNANEATYTVTYQWVY